MKEIWRPVPNFIGYEVSSFGRVRSLLNKNIKVLSVADGSGGYQIIALQQNKKRRTQLVHRLVLLAFIGEPKKGQLTCHYDGNKKNNRLSNLRWDSQSNNYKDRIRHGTDFGGEKSRVKKLSVKEVLEIRKSQLTYIEISKKYGIHNSHVWRIKTKLCWRSV